LNQYLQMATWHAGYSLSDGSYGLPDWDLDSGLMVETVQRPQDPGDPEPQIFLDSEPAAEAEGAPVADDVLEPEEPTVDLSKDALPAPQVLSESNPNLVRDFYSDPQAFRQFPHLPGPELFELKHPMQGRTRNPTPIVKGLRAADAW
jgi:hypothetical protein